MLGFSLLSFSIILEFLALSLPLSYTVLNESILPRIPSIRPNPGSIADSYVVKEKRRDDKATDFQYQDYQWHDHCVSPKWWACERGEGCGIVPSRRSVV